MAHAHTGTRMHDMTDNPTPSSKDGSGTSARGTSYSDYLQLDRILHAQQPLSTAHDETLFIIQHQTSELWMKLAIHELNATCRLIAADDLQPAFKTLARVSRILEQLNSAWDVLRTMTPSEYTRFRGSLGQSSGLQSLQYRMIEFLVGNKHAVAMQAHEHDEAAVARATLALGVGIGVVGRARRLTGDIGGQRLGWVEHLAGDGLGGGQLGDQASEELGGGRGQKPDRHQGREQYTAAQSCGGRRGRLHVWLPSNAG